MCRYLYCLSKLAKARITRSRISKGVQPLCLTGTRPGHAAQLAAVQPRWAPVSYVFCQSFPAHALCCTQSQDNGPAWPQSAQLEHSIALCRLAGLVELNLSSLQIESRDVARIFGAFPHLRALRLESCKKLRSNVVHVLVDQAAHGTSQPRSRRPDRLGSSPIKHSSGCPHDLIDSTFTASDSHCRRLELLDMRRCYQLTEAALTVVLQQTGRSQLRGVLLSHLSLEAWPAGSGVGAAPCNLQILAINNSVLLTSRGLQVHRCTITLPPSALRRTCAGRGPALQGGSL